MIAMVENIGFFSAHRGDIFYADLEPVIGSEQGGIRPVLIIQNNIGNRHSPTVIVAAITSREKDNRMPTHVHIDGWHCGLPTDSTVMLEQLRTLDKQRLQSYIGSVNKSTMCEIDHALEISIGLFSNEIMQGKRGNQHERTDTGKKEHPPDADDY